MPLQPALQVDPHTVEQHIVRIRPCPHGRHTERSPTCTQCSPGKVCRRRSWPWSSGQVASSIGLSLVIPQTTTPRGAHLLLSLLSQGGTCLLPARRSLHGGEQQRQLPLLDLLQRLLGGEDLRLQGG